MSFGTTGDSRLFSWPPSRELAFRLVTNTATGCSRFTMLGGVNQELFLSITLHVHVHVHVNIHCVHVS